MISAFAMPGQKPDRKSYSKIPQILEVPHLIQTQLNSFNWFLRDGLKELFDEISPIKDFTATRFELRLNEVRHL